MSRPVLWVGGTTIASKMSLGITLLIYSQSYIDNISKSVRKQKQAFETADSSSWRAPFPRSSRQRMLWCWRWRLWCQRRWYRWSASGASFTRRRAGYKISLQLKFNFSRSDQREPDFFTRTVNRSCICQVKSLQMITTEMARSLILLCRSLVMQLFTIYTFKGLVESQRRCV